MDIKELNYYYNKFKFGEDNYHNLMKKRVTEILLVSTFYDAFIFEQDGRLSEQIYGEYRQLNLSTAPRITSVPTGQQALEILKKKKFDLVITMMRIGDITPFSLSKEVKKSYPEIPVLLLLNVRSDINIVEQNQDNMDCIDDVFLWNGDTKLFLAMIKYIEDIWNVDYDTEQGFVNVILIVEDSIEYYSLFLPLLYGVILKQTQKLIVEEVNDINKRLRMRGRPKVLLVHDYQDAVRLIEKHKDHLFAVISDVKYPNNGVLDPDSGLKLIQKIHEMNPELPTVLQSSNLINAERAEAIGAQFFHKYSATMLKDLRRFINKKLGFGEFSFMNKKGVEVDSAQTMREFEEKLKSIPDDSLLYHSELNHFSGWLIAHGEIVAAKRIKPMQTSEFENVTGLRTFLINTFKEVRHARTRGKIINFTEERLNEVDHVIRLSEGSLGGKGRGLAFLNALLCTMEFDEKIPEVNITLPSTAIIGTSEFDSFTETNLIGSWLTEKTDDEIQRYFLEGVLTDQLMEKLEIYIKEIKYPIAVRSSGLLEDSQSQPFAGIYETYMLPNNDKNDDVRLKQLCDAIKLVFASVFVNNTRKYIESIHYKLEEEKMAVIIQEIVGSRHFEEQDGTIYEYYYPHFSGVGQSYNFYPTSHMDHGDGVVSLAIGLGKAVVEGERNYRFCPKYPKMEAVSQQELIKDSQKYFYALNLGDENFDLSQGEDATLSQLNISHAEKHNTLNHMASVWDYQNGRMIPGLSAKGLRVITFANILKYNYFPLAKIMEEILEIGEKAMGVPVEIEFAVNLDQDTKKLGIPTFYVLQVRPLTINMDEINIDVSNLKREDLWLYTSSGMGNGMIDEITDVIYIDRNKFDKTKTEKMCLEINKLNEKMKKEGRKYILLGPGRWGTRDKFLGVPVKWSDIDQAKIIIEYSLKDFVIEASQGTHFFHNLVAMNVGYFTIPFAHKEDFIDWEWLESQAKVETTEYFSHVKFEKPVVVKMDGRNGISLIQK